ncbi:MAG: hypothetical protein U1E99_10720 [Agitococcus sp.]
MRVFVVLMSSIFLNSIAYAASPIEGTYDCNECNGLLEIKKSTPDSYSVKIVVGQGSCGGEVITKGRSRLFNGKELKIPYKDKKKSCIAKIEFTDNVVSVSDSCYTAEDEAGSTCATLGEYSKR